MLHATPYDRQGHWPKMRALVTRYDRVEPDTAENTQVTAEDGLAGVNWLTFIGGKHLFDDRARRLSYRFSP